jgi:chemotaxis protein MotB
MAGGKGGGAWKVAYADFVTAMMAFFMVMWLTSQSQPVKESIASYFREPYRASQSKSDSPGGPALQKRESNGRYPPTTSKPSVSEEAYQQVIRPMAMRTKDGDRTHIGAAALFAEGSAELDAAAQKELSDLAPQLAGKPQRIEIRAHASRKPLDPNGPYPDAWALCYARCQATMQFLKDLGISEDRMRLSQGGSGHYPIALAAPGRDVTGPEMLSRVDVFLVSEIVPTAVASEANASSAVKPPSEDEHSEPHGESHGHGG